MEVISFIFVMLLLTLGFFLVVSFGVTGTWYAGLISISYILFVGLIYIPFFLKQKKEGGKQ